MKPSEFFALVPEVTPDILKVAEDSMDTDETAQALVTAIESAALVDYEGLTGRQDYPATPQNANERKLREVYLCFLNAATLRLIKYRTAADAKKVHNPDVQMNVAFNLDLVRVIGRAERGAMQRARKILRGDQWLSDLTTVNRAVG